MYRFLRGLESTEWHMVWVFLFIGSFTLSLVFAGTVNESVNQRTTSALQSEPHSGQYTSSLSVPRHPSSPRVSTRTTPNVSGIQTRKIQDSSSADGEVSLLLDLSKNLLLVKRGNHIIYTALAATGSGKVLQDPQDPSRKWKFETPRGTFTIESKLKKPVWIRPDWAFIEKGVPVPKEQNSRLLPNALGDYALGFGDGYFIHGALYTYLLGFNATHGCVQLNDKDLRYIYETIPVGAKLVIM